MNTNSEANKEASDIPVDLIDIVIQISTLEIELHANFKDNQCVKRRRKIYAEIFSLLAEENQVIERQSKKTVDAVWDELNKKDVEA